MFHGPIRPMHQGEGGVFAVHRRPQDDHVGGVALRGVQGRMEDGRLGRQQQDKGQGSRSAGQPLQAPLAEAEHQHQRRDQEGQEGGVVIAGGPKGPQGGPAAYESRQHDGEGPFRP